MHISFYSRGRRFVLPNHPLLYVLGWRSRWSPQSVVRSLDVGCIQMLECWLCTGSSCSSGGYNPSWWAFPECCVASVTTTASSEPWKSSAYGRCPTVPRVIGRELCAWTSATGCCHSSRSALSQMTHTRLTSSATFPSRKKLSAQGCPTLASFSCFQHGTWPPSPLDSNEPSYTKSLLQVQYWTASSEQPNRFLSTPLFTKRTSCIQGDSHTGWIVCMETCLRDHSIFSSMGKEPKPYEQGHKLPLWGPKKLPPRGLCQKEFWAE